MSDLRLRQMRNEEAEDVARLYALGVDAENETGALSLYERVGLRPISRADNWVLDL